MDPEKDKPDVGESGKPAETGQNGTPVPGPFSGPQPIRLTPEQLEEIRHLWTEEDERLAAEAVKEILAGGGYQFEDFFPELKRLAGIDD